MTSINNHENNQKIYQFLQMQGGISEAAGSDGVVTKSEFREFLEEGGFDFSALDGWNGEKAKESKNDIINNFWKTINTNTSISKIKGTKVRNSGALDANEQQAVMNRIAASEKLDLFMETIEIPSFVSNQDSAKQEIQEKLMKLVETNFLKKNVSLDKLGDFLDEKAPLITNQVVVEVYAAECIAENLGDASKEYNYKYGDDATLKQMINNLVKNLSEDTEESEIQEAIENLVKGYLATAGLGDADNIPVGRRAANAEDGTLEDVDPISADAVWYAPSNNSNLNDLQKAVLETTLKKTFDAVVKSYGSDYEAYPELFDKAVADFITETVKNAKNGTFEAVKAYGKTEFEASEIGKNLLKTVQVKKITVGSTLGERIKSEFTESLADYISTNRRYLKAMTDIENRMIEKALNGEFGEPLDENKIIDSILKEIKAHVAEFYENGFGDMDLETLNKTYDVMNEAANSEANDDKSIAAHRDAAVKYCETLANKNEKFKEAVILVFGKDYKGAIAKMLPGDIETKINDLMKKVNELGDASTFKLEASSWGSLTTKGIYDLNTVKDAALKYLAANNIPGRGDYRTSFFNISSTIITNAINAIQNAGDVNTIMAAINTIRNQINGTLPNFEAPKSIVESSAIEMRVGTTQTFNIAPKFTDKNGNIITPTSDRIEYRKSNSLIEVAEDGTVTVKAGSQVGNFDTTIQILVDGVVVGEKTIRIVVHDKADFSSENKEFQGTTIADHINNGHTALQLSWFAEWGDAKTNAKNNITNYVNNLAEVLKNAGYTAEKVDKAAQTLKNYYNAVIDAIFDNCYGSGSNRNTTINVNYADADGNVRTEQTWYNQNTHCYEKDAGRTDEGARNISHDSCGIRMNESYSGTNTYEYYINTAVLLKKFQEFYNAI